MTVPDRSGADRLPAAGGAYPLTDALLRSIVDFKAEEIDEAASGWAVWCLLDLFGCMLAATAPRFAIGARLAEYVRRQGARPASRIVGLSEATSPALAAFVNGTLGYYCDSEPRHTRSVIHVLPPVVAAALAIADREGVTGQEFLTAVVLGVEVACRMSAALDPTRLYARGFHPTAVAGVFGAAAAAGRLLRLQQELWPSAVGLAGQQAGGLLAWVTDPSEDSRAASPGFAAAAGVAAAELAALGVGGPPHVLDGTFTVLRAFTGAAPSETVFGLPGRPLCVQELAAKRHASCGFLHAGIDALLEVMAAEGVSGDSIDTIDLRLAESQATVVDGHALKSHNAQYILAVAAATGGVTIHDIHDDRRILPAVERLSHAVRVHPDPTLDAAYPAQYGAIVTVRTRDGRALTRRVEYPKGWPQNPLTRGEWMDKYTAMATVVCSPHRAQRIAEMTLSIPHLTSMAPLTEALSRSPS